VGQLVEVRVFSTAPALLKILTPIKPKAALPVFAGEKAFEMQRITG
jgi:hypothetical protein